MTRATPIIAAVLSLGLASPCPAADEGDIANALEPLFEMAAPDGDNAVQFEARIDGCRASFEERTYDFKDWEWMRTRIVQVDLTRTRLAPDPEPATLHFIPKGAVIYAPRPPKARREAEPRTRPDESDAPPLVFRPLGKSPFGEPPREWRGVDPELFPELPTRQSMPSPLRQPWSVSVESSDRTSRTVPGGVRVMLHANRDSITPERFRTAQPDLEPGPDTARQGPPVSEPERRELPRRRTAPDRSEPAGRARSHAAAGVPSSFAGMLKFDLAVRGAPPETEREVIVVPPDAEVSMPIVGSVRELPIMLVNLYARRFCGTD